MSLTTFMTRAWSFRPAGDFTGWFAASDPSVLVDGDVLRMFYTDANSDGTTIRPIIAEAVSSDGYTWTQVGGNAGIGTVVAPNDGARANVETATVFKAGGTYIMLYSGYADGNLPPGQFAADLYAATSADGVTFTDVSPAPVLARTEGWYDNDAVFSPTVLAYGGGYVMLYAGHNYNDASLTESQFGVWLLGATSPDGLNWTKLAAPVMAGDPAIAWMSGGVAEPSLVAGPDGKFYVFFSALSGPERSIGLAVADSPFGPWTVAPDPVVTAASAGLAAGGGVVAPHAELIGGVLRLWFTKIGADGSYSVGYVESDWGGGSTAPTEWTNRLGTGLDDQIFGDDGRDAVAAAGGSDLVLTAGGHDSISAGDGDDMVWSGTGNDDAVGGGGHDVLYLEEGDDTADAGDGDDIVAAGEGADRVVAGIGQDAVDGGGGDDTIDGGDGDDMVWAGTGNDAVQGGGGHDVLYLEEGNDTADAGDGDDIVAAGDGADRIVAGLGHDSVDGGGGGDTIDGGEGDDALFGGEDDDAIDAGNGADYIDGGSGSDTLLGGAGNDMISAGEADAGSASNHLEGGSGEDGLVGFAGADTMDGGADNDVIYGGAGNDTLLGGAGDDILSGEEDDDRLAGGAGADAVIGGLGIDTADYSASAGVTVALDLSEAFTGDAAGDYLDSIENLVGSSVGSDRLVGDAGANRLEGLGGADTLDGRAGADTLIGGAGDDLFLLDNLGDVVIELPGQGTDTIRTTLASYSLAALPNVENLTYGGAATFIGTGNDGANALTGGAGADTLIGGKGADILAGGVGRDVFRYLQASEGGDTLIAFSSVDDTIQVSAAGFLGGLVPGALPNNRFVLGTTASRGFGQFIYDRPAGRLLWDADGTGAAAPVQLASMGSAPGPLLSVADIVVV